jgi:tetratricopeptide (TPR) repeat protein
MGMGAVHRATGDIGAAAAAYQRALQLDLRLGEAWNGLLSTALAGGRTEAALDVARAATTAVPRDAEPWLALAMLEPERAREHLIKGVEMLPEEPRLLVALAEHHLSVGRPADAYALADRAASLDPWSDGARALRLYAKAITDGVLTVDGWRALESLRKANPADPASRAAAERAATSWPRAAATWLVHARFRQGDAAAVQGDLRRALDLDPGNDEAQAALGQGGLQADKLARQPRGPGKGACRWINGKHRAQGGEIGGAQHLGPGQQKLGARGDGGAGGRGAGDQLLGHEDARRKNGLVTRGGVGGERLAQAATGLAGGHDHELVGEIKRSGAGPVGGEPGDDGRHQRLVPRQNVKAR